MELEVELTSISKEFGKTRALSEVNLRVKKGTIHAVVGENGAGKTTLMRILYGAIRPTSGTVIVSGTERRFRNSAEAIGAGVGMVSQHYAIIPGLTCLENLVLGAEPNRFWNREQTQLRATELATKMGFSFNWSEDAESLSPAAAQKLEILKLLWKSASIMILDEPTAMLSPQDAAALFQSLTKLTESGVTVLLVTHRIQEVLDYCQQVTVLRSGAVALDAEVATLNAETITEAVVGGQLIQVPSPSLQESNRIVLELKDLTVQGERGEEAVKKASFVLRSGELLGIAGVDGNGQRELVQALLGIAKITDGTCLFEGNDLTNKSVSERLKGGMAVVAEDRLNEAVIPDWSLAWNGILGSQRGPRVCRNGLILGQEREKQAQAAAEAFHTKYESTRQAIHELSGGNQQRFVVGRTVLTAEKLLIAFQPTRGLDINATRNVYRKLRELCESGLAVLVVSFDIDEILEFCDRILVIFGGKISSPAPGSERDRQEIGKLMTGAK